MTCKLPEEFIKYLYSRQEKYQFDLSPFLPILVKKRKPKLNLQSFEDGYFWSFVHNISYENYIGKDCTTNMLSEISYRVSTQHST